MKKNYENPIIEIICFDEDIITSSNEKFLLFEDIPDGEEEI